MFMFWSCFWFFGKEIMATNMAEVQKAGTRLQGLRRQHSAALRGLWRKWTWVGEGGVGEPGPEGTSAAGRQRRKRKGGAHGPVSKAPLLLTPG